MKFPNIASFLKSATTNINIASATAPSNGQVLTATSSTTAAWQTVASGGGGDKLLQDYQGVAVIGVLGKADYTTTGTINEVTLIADSIPVGSNLIVELRKNSTTSGNILSSTLQIATSDTLTNGQKSVSTTSFSSASIADGDYFVAYLTSVGSTTPALNARLIIR